MAFDKFIGAFVDQQLKDLLIEQANREGTTLSHQIREILIKELNADHDEDSAVAARG